MTYYIHPFWFYLMGICGNVGTVAIIFTILLALAIVVILCAAGVLAFDEEWTLEEAKDFFTKVKFKKIFTSMSLFIFLAVLMPSKETCMQMIVASTVTKENVEDTVEYIEDIVKEVNDALNGEGGKDTSAQP